MQMLKYIISCFYSCFCCASFSYCSHCSSCFNSAAELAFAVKFAVEAFAIDVVVVVAIATDVQAFAITVVEAFGFVEAAGS